MFILLIFIINTISHSAPAMIRVFNRVKVVKFYNSYFIHCDLHYNKCHIINFNTYFNKISLKSFFLIEWSFHQVISFCCKNEEG